MRSARFGLAILVLVSFWSLPRAADAGHGVRGTRSSSHYYRSHRSWDGMASPYYRPPHSYYHRPPHSHLPYYRPPHHRYRSHYPPAYLPPPYLPPPPPAYQRRYYPPTCAAPYGEHHGGGFSIYLPRFGFAIDF